jgi:glucosamine 6-phosphate synthetase-like amidotransferase/phosphosugar isomerase protein
VAGALAERGVRTVRLVGHGFSVVPGQLFAAALARAKGFDPDRPAGLTKVTLAE